MRRFAGVLLVVSALTATRPARADNDIVWLVAFLVGPAVTANTALTIYDVVKTAEDKPIGEGAAWVQAIGGTPQALFATPFAIWGAVSDDSTASTLGLVFMVPAMTTTALASHGIWALSTENEDPARSFFMSSAIGINTSLTLFAASAGIAGGLSKRPFAIAQLVASAPVIGGGIYHLATGGDYTTDAVVMTSWSSLLFVHGGLSLLLPEYAVDFSEDAKGEDASLSILPTTLPDLSADGMAPGVVIGGHF